MANNDMEFSIEESLLKQNRGVLILREGNEMKENEPEVDPWKALDKEFEHLPQHPPKGVVPEPSNEAVTLLRQKVIERLTYVSLTLRDSGVRCASRALLPLYSVDDWISFLHMTLGSVESVDNFFDSIEESDYPHVFDSHSLYDARVIAGLLHDNMVHCLNRIEKQTTDVHLTVTQLSALH